MKSDPYILSGESVRNPPQGFLQKLRHTGPGFILSASVVGSGELISTTTLGAKAGFVTFWVIILSCLVKVAIQLEFGKQAIRTGETVMHSLNKLQGPRFGRQKANWTLWSWLVLWIIKPVQVGGIIGGVAVILNMAIPSVGIFAFAVIIGLSVALLVYKGLYSGIEKMSLVIMGLFTAFTLVAVYLLKFTPYAFSWADIGKGLTFTLPRETVGFALAAFGLTGVGGDEIVAYNYWCLEKGYARYTGPYTDTPEWRERARGWIKVMVLDSVISMIGYTLVTGAFYLLGAAVLNKIGQIPEGYQTIEVISAMYTESFGSWARGFYLFGAFVVLYSTLLSALAAWTRIFSDLSGQMGWIRFYDQKERHRMIAILAWTFPCLWIIAFFVIKLPVLMITMGGIITFVMLQIIVYAGFDFRFRRDQYGIPGSAAYNTALIISGAAIIFVALYSVVKLF